MKFSIKDFFSKYYQIRRKLSLVPFTEEILDGKLHFLYSACGVVFFYCRQLVFLMVIFYNGKFVN